MTLIASMLTKDGWVIGADKRSHDRIRGTIDTNIKIIQLGQYAAVAFTGTSEFVDANTFHPYYSAKVLTIQHYHELEPVGLDSLHLLSVKWKEEFVNYLASLPAAWWPESPANGCLFQGLFYHYDHLADTLEYTQDWRGGGTPHVK